MNSEQKEICKIIKHLRKLINQNWISINMELMKITIKNQKRLSVTRDLSFHKKIFKGEWQNRSILSYKKSIRNTKNMLLQQNNRCNLKIRVQASTLKTSMIKSFWLVILILQHNPLSELRSQIHQIMKKLLSFKSLAKNSTHTNHHRSKLLVETMQSMMQRK